MHRPVLLEETIAGLAVRADGLAAFLERALAKKAEQRFQTGEEFGGALRAALAGGAPQRAVAASGGVDIEL